MTDEEWQQDQRWACARKKAYQTERQARHVASKPEIVAREGRPLRVYQCPMCSMYHLSKAPARKGWI